MIIHRRRWTVDRSHIHDHFSRWRGCGAWGAVVGHRKLEIAMTGPVAVGCRYVNHDAAGMADSGSGSGNFRVPGRAVSGLIQLAVGRKL